MVKSISEIIEEVTGRGPKNEHKLIYDSPSETLEPIYFFILDLMNDLGLETEKLVDNFVSSPGSQHFGEMGQRSSIMQQQGAKLLGDINTVLRSILNLIYDLREFRIRLQSYKDLKNPDKKASALLSLKQIWMDKVDIQKGNSSIKAMALGQSGFNTLIDAFLIVNEEKEVDNLDLNQIVKRILKPRIHEFNNWIKESKAELEKRYKIEKIYLKSQINSLKVYTKWAKPYLKAAQDLEMAGNSKNPSLVKMFNSLLLELTLFGKKTLNIKEQVKMMNYPEFFGTEKFLNSVKETYYSCVLVDFNFRGIPSKTQQGYVIGGRAEVTFRGYGITGTEIKRIYEEIENSDLNDGLDLIEGITTESLGQLKEDIDYFLGEEEEEKEESKKKEGSNPFLALFGFYNESKEKRKDKTEKGKIRGVYPKQLKWYEKEYFIPTIEKNAEEITKTIFELYKKAHGMSAFPA